MALDCGAFERSAILYRSFTHRSFAVVQDAGMKTKTLFLLFALATPLFADEGNPQIDYKAFVSLTTKLEPERQARRISEDEFLKMAAENGVVVLDTRSKAKFDKLHVKGAKHLNFSDFTEEALTQVIPKKDTPILIYCNNNFADARSAMPTKSAPLALNIPTYINLRGYGYTQVYELKDFKSVKDTKIPFAGTDVEKQKALKKLQQLNSQR